MKMNVERLRKIIEVIKAEPRRFDITDWGYGVASDRIEMPPCGTVACIGGWACLLFDEAIAAEFEKQNKPELSYMVHRMGGKSIENHAVELLGLTVFQGAALFHVDRWPTEFHQRWRNAAEQDDKVAIADITAERIEFLIAEGQ